MRMDNLGLSFDFRWKPKAKGQQCEQSFENLAKYKVAEFPGIFVSCYFFKTGWAGVESARTGLVCISGALLPS